MHPDWLIARDVLRGCVCQRQSSGSPHPRHRSESKRLSERPPVNAAACKHDDCPDTLHEGDLVKIFSRTAHEWVEGEIVRFLKGGFVRIEYGVGDYWCGKVLHLHSQHLVAPCTIEEIDPGRLIEVDDKLFECAICHNLCSRDCINCIKCNNIFCRSHVKDLARCPCCHHAPFGFAENVALQRIITQIRQYRGIKTLPSAPDVGMSQTLMDQQIAMAYALQYAEEMGIAVEAFECQCCFEKVPEMTGLHMSPGAEGCDHVICPECFRRLVSGQIEKKELCTCPLCPAASASVVPSWLVRSVLGDGMAARLSDVEQIHLGMADGGQIRLWECPTPDCRNRRVVDEDWDPQQVPDTERIVNCEFCNKRICVRCNVEEHEGFSCQHFREWRQANNSSEQSYAVMMQQGLIKPCPKCATPILKNGGCDHMTCQKCRYEFWWTSLEPYLLPP